MEAASSDRKPDALYIMSGQRPAGRTRDLFAYEAACELFAILEAKKLRKLAPDVLRYVGGRDGDFGATGRTQFRMRAPAAVPNCLKDHEDVEVRVVERHMFLLYLVK